jgi:hypothetical protein
VDPDTGQPRESLQDQVRISQVRKCRVSLAGEGVIVSESCPYDENRTARGPGAVDVILGVPDDDGAARGDERLGGERAAAPPAAEGEGHEVVPVLVVVAEGAEAKVELIHESCRGELPPRSGEDVPGDEAVVDADAP